MAKRNETTSTDSTPGTGTGLGRTIKRREFVSAIAKAALPTIAVIGLGRRAQAEPRPAAPAKGVPGSPQGRSTNPNECVLTCEGGCRGCEGECLGTCKDACFLTCEGSCKYTCEGGCNTTCEGGCKGGCGGQCSSGAW